MKKELRMAFVDGMIKSYSHETDKINEYQKKYKQKITEVHDSESTLSKLKAEAYDEHLKLNMTIVLKSGVKIILPMLFLEHALDYERVALMVTDIFKHLELEEQK